MLPASPRHLPRTLFVPPGLPRGRRADFTALAAARGYARRSMRRLLLLCAAATLVACGARTFESRATTPPPEDGADDVSAAGGGTWSECYAGFAPTGNARSDLGRLTRACGPTGGMRAITAVTEATQQESDPVDRYTFFVPKAGACYRVYAVGERTVSDLDLLVRGPTGEDVAADLTNDPFPVLPPRGPLCFEVPGVYMLEVSVFRGQGKYAIQVWGNTDGLGQTTP